MSKDSCRIIQDNIDELRRKRVSLMVKVWDHLADNEIVDTERFNLSTPLVNEVVEHYLDDVRVIKCRYKIDDKIQLHKIAGLLTSLIVRYRPIIPMIQEYANPKEIYTNEIFAIMHGLAICGEHSLENMETVAQSNWFDEWMSDFLYLLHARNHTPESLNFIYQTFCIFNFPNNFKSTRL